MTPEQLLNLLTEAQKVIWNPLHKDRSKVLTLIEYALKHRTEIVAQVPHDLMPLRYEDFENGLSGAEEFKEWTENQADQQLTEHEKNF